MRSSPYICSPTTHRMIHFQFLHFQTCDQNWTWNTTTPVLKKKYLLTSTCQCSSQQYSIHVYLYLPKSIDSSQLVETNGWLPSLQNIRIRESITLVLLSQCTPDILKIIRSISGFGRETIVESLEKRLSQSKSYVFTIYFIIFQSFANFLRLNFNVTAWKGFVNICLFVLLLTS